MTVPIQATIISEDESFIHKFQRLLEAFRFSVQRCTGLKDFFSKHTHSRSDFCIIDNKNNQFPYPDFFNLLEENTARTFLLNVGPPVLDNHSPCLIFNLDPERDTLSLKSFLKVTRDLLMRQRARSELADMLIHDIRSPLNSLIGYVELLLSGTFGQLNEGHQKILEKVMDLGDTTLDLLQDLNEIYEKEQYHFQLQKQPFDLNELLDVVLANLWIQADKKNIQIRRIIPENFKKLYGDDYQIQRVLTNLIGNAIKYSPENSHITIRGRAQNEHYAEISVEDNGRGVPEKHLKKLFEKYYRLPKDQDNPRGFGLGLYICRIIVKIHRGHIWAKNNPSGGLTISFSLPFAGEEK